MLYEVPNPNKSYIVEKSSEYLINKYEGVSFVKVQIPEDMYIPPLPYRQEKLIFPTGTFAGFYTHIEIRNALKHGAKILDYGSGIFYTETIDLFSSFVTKHYKERLKLKAKGSPLQVMEKLVLNNLYGKWGFNYRDCSQVIPARKLDPKKHIKEGARVIPIAKGKFFSVTTDVAPPVYSFPIWSVYITARARILMYEYLNDHRLKDKLIYTDTDSIFLTNHAGEITSSKELGEMSLEDGYPVKEAIFIRPKNYYTHKYKCKGIRTIQDGIDKGDQIFQDVLKNIKIKQKRFTKFRTALRSENHHKYGKLQPNQIITVTKQVSLEDDKRLWDKPFDPTTWQDSIPRNI